MSFNGEIARVGYIDLCLSEEFIASATRLPIKGEKWFKGGRISNRAWKQFLINPTKEIVPSHGVPVRLIKKYWRDMLVLINRCNSYFVSPPRCLFASRINPNVDQLLTGSCFMLVLS